MAETFISPGVMSALAAAPIFVKYANLGPPDLNVYNALKDLGSVLRGQHSLVESLMVLGAAEGMRKRLGLDSHEEAHLQLDIGTIEWLMDGSPMLDVSVRLEALHFHSDGSGQRSVLRAIQLFSELNRERSAPHAERDEGAALYQLARMIHPELSLDLLSMAEQYLTGAVFGGDLSAPKFLASLYARRGDLLIGLGEQTEGLSWYEESCALFEALAADDDDALLAWGRVGRDLSETLRLLDRLDDAELAIGGPTMAIERSPESGEMFRALAIMCHEWGLVRQTRGFLEESLDLFGKSIDCADRSRKFVSEYEWAKRRAYALIGGGHSAFAIAAATVGREKPGLYETAARYYEEAIHLLQGIAEDELSDQDQVELASCRHALRMAALRLGT